MTLLIVALAGLAAGFMNVVAGGGSFLTLPAMMGAGLTALGANASSTVAMFPAQLVTAFMSRAEITRRAADAAEPRLSMPALSLISLVGGLGGALLLLVTPPGLFVKIVPWLILFATAVFAGGPSLSRRAGGLRLDHGAVYAIQSAVAVYGGYFGGGIGILMLAALTLFGLRDMRVMNGIKILLAMLMNVAAVATFILAGLVQWRPALVLCVTSVGGSLIGMLAARRVSARYVRAFVILVGVVLTIGFFWKSGPV